MINAHLEKIAATMLGVTTLLIAIRAFVTDTRARSGLDLLEWAMLAWFLVLPLATVWWALRERSLMDDPRLRGLVMALIVTLYLGIDVALRLR